VATLEQRIVAALKTARVPLDDDELAARLEVVRQAVNQAARKLEKRLLVQRYVGPSGKIVNRLAENALPIVATSRPHPNVSPPSPAAAFISEDEVKQAIKEHLEAQGYEVTVAWGRERGIDIDARRAGDHLVIEAKAEVVRPQQQVNYFLGAIGELVQRMSDPDARYGLALPDNRQYRGLVDRLPSTARERLGLVVFFVARGTDGWKVVEA